MEFTHYHPESKTLFELGLCENCNGAVVEPNAVGCEEPVAKLVGLGIKIHAGTLPPELEHNDELGHSCCAECRPAGNAWLPDLVGERFTSTKRKEGA
jgi:hypothetical protein